MLLAESGTASRQDSLHVASILDQLSIALRRGGKSSDPEARIVCDRALRIKEEILGTQDSSYAFSLQNLGGLLLNKGAYDEAKPILERTLRIREATLGLSHPDVATSLLWLGNYHSRVGDYARAEPMMRRSLAMRRAALPADDPAIAECVSALGAVLFNVGDLVEALSLYEEAIESTRRRLGKDHPALGEAHHNLGAMLLEAGDLAEARVQLDEALRIRLGALGEEHPLTASTLSVLASTLQETGATRAAGSHYERALRIRRRVLGNDAPETAWTMMKLGLLHLERREWTQAKSLLDEALRVQEAGLGPDHHDVAWTLIGLAKLEERKGNGGRARDQFERALRIQTLTYGEDGPEVARTLGQYAGLLARSGSRSEALQAALRGARIGREHLRAVSRGFAERQSLAYAGSSAYGLDVALSLTHENLGSSAESTVELVWDALVRSRLLVLDEVMARQHLVSLAMEDSTVIRAAKDLDRARQRLANLLVGGVGGGSPARFQESVRASRQDVDTAERALAAVSGAYRSSRGSTLIGWSDVGAAIPEGSCLVAYVTYSAPTGTREYLALVKRSGRAARAVSLGRARTIDSLIGRWAVSVAVTSSGEASGTESQCRAAGVTLRRRVWDPIGDDLIGAERIYIVPDGAVYRISFAALPTPAGRYLAESGPALHYLSSERDLVNEDLPRSGAGLLAIGDPSFGSRSDQTGPRHGRPTPPGSVDCSDLSNVRFARLPESGTEADIVGRLWPDPGGAVVLRRTEATEKAFKTLAPGKRTLHLATHAFFLNGKCGPSGSAHRGIGGLKPKSTFATRVAGMVPLQLSGLALAGANRRDAAREGEDGILTAQEVASLDLSSTEWAVLSACDTGVGEIQAWEGVLGLRRAFQAAGARTTIMSLWPVEDRAARAWMEALYRARLQRGMTVVESVREANLKVLRSRRAQGRSTHPSRWAAFVAVGDAN